MRPPAARRPRPSRRLLPAPAQALPARQGAARAPPPLRLPVRRSARRDGATSGAAAPARGAPRRAGHAPRAPRRHPPAARRPRRPPWGGWNWGPIRPAAGPEPPPPRGRVRPRAPAFPAPPSGAPAPGAAAAPGLPRRPARGSASPPLPPVPATGTPAAPAAAVAPRGKGWEEEPRRRAAAGPGQSALEGVRTHGSP